MLRLAPIAIVIAVSAAGCGGSSGTTKTKLVAEADPICKQVAVARAAANTAIAKAGSSTSKSLKIVARVAPPIGAEELKAVAKLRTIKAPASLESDWRQLLSGMEQLGNDASALGAHAKAGEYKALTSITASGRKLRERLTKIATRDGFSYCGRTS